MCENVEGLKKKKKRPGPGERKTFMTQICHAGVHLVLFFFFAPAAQLKNGAGALFFLGFGAPPLPLGITVTTAGIPPPSPPIIGGGGGGGGAPPPPIIGGGGGTCTICGSCIILGILLLLTLTLSLFFILFDLPTGICWLRNCAASGGGGGYP